MELYFFILFVVKATIIINILKNCITVKELRVAMIVGRTDGRTVRQRRLSNKVPLAFSTDP